MGKKWKRLQKIRRAKAARLSAEVASQEVVEAPAPTTKKVAEAPKVEIKETVTVAEKATTTKAKKTTTPKAKRTTKTAKTTTKRTTKK